MGKITSDNQRIYWLIFQTLAVQLLIFLLTPMRFFPTETAFDIIFFSGLTLICFGIAIYIYTRYGTDAIWLIILIMICVILSGWQMFNLIRLRESSVALATLQYNEWLTEDGYIFKLIRARVIFVLKLVLVIIISRSLSIYDMPHNVLGADTQDSMLIQNSQAYYFRIFKPLAITLLLCIWFPIRIWFYNLVANIILFGLIAVFSLAVVINIMAEAQHAAPLPINVLITPASTPL